MSELSDDRMELALAYAEPHPVKLFRRTIAASTTQPALDIGLAIEVREPCALPIGIHATFRLPIRHRAAKLCLGEEARAWTSPVSLEPDIRGVPLDRVPLLSGADEDVTRLPLPYAAKEIVLASGHSGWAVLRNLDEAYTPVLAWDASIFPACQLWLSNRGRGYYPWNNRFVALGIEPICAAFDLGTRASQLRGNLLR